MSKPLKVLITVIVLVIIIAASCFFTVQEGQEALVLRLGKLVTLKTAQGEKQPLQYVPGLHFKLPVIDTIKKFDYKRWIFNPHEL